MQENMKLIDLLIELVDARIPLSSRNPDIDRLGQGKLRMVLLNKSDLADPAYNQQWIEWFRERGAYVLETDSRTGSGAKAAGSLVRDVCREKTERDRKRGIVNRPVRAMVVGIPNVGKSTFINSFAGKACAKTGNKPGVTKGKQWIRPDKGLELLDTPGILWPKFDDPQAGMHLALIGAMNDEAIPTEELACDLLKCLKQLYPDTIGARYDVPWRETMPEVLEEIAGSRGCLVKGGGPDLKKAAGIVLEDFRSGRLGRITLERPDRTTG